MCMGGNLLVWERELYVLKVNKYMSCSISAVSMVYVLPYVYGGVQQLQRPWSDQDGGHDPNMQVNKLVLLVESDHQRL